MSASAATKIKYDARKLNSSEQALLRQMAVSRVMSGESVASVTRAYGLGDKTLYKWLRTYKVQRARVLVQSAKKGRRRQLGEEQFEEVLDWMIAEPGRMWLRVELLDKIQRTMDVSCSATTLGRLLAACGLVTPKREEVFQSYVAGNWLRKNSEAVQELVRRKRAERLSLTRVTIKKPCSQSVWRGWAAYGVRGGMMLLNDGDLLTVLRDINHSSESAQVIRVDMPIPSHSAWCAQLASLKNITLLCVELKQ